MNDTPPNAPPAAPPPDRPMTTSLPPVHLVTTKYDMIARALAAAVEANAIVLTATGEVPAPEVYILRRRGEQPPASYNTIAAELSRLVETHLGVPSFFVTFETVRQWEHGAVPGAERPARPATTTPAAPVVKKTVPVKRVMKRRPASGDVPSATFLPPPDGGA